ncbi:MAG TPA: hypothetical protein VFV73_33930 [Streptosporangiaceae bacterium]|nr:hypothetical protein [Streptosporangiaceae bacterium]
MILTHPDSVRGADASEGLDQLERFWDLVNRWASTAYPLATTR